MLNSCNFTGRLAAEPKYFEGENSRAVFCLAVDRDRKGADGNYETDFLDFVAWNGTADFVNKWFHKGDQVTVANARAQVRVYTDDEGVTKRRVEFVAEKVYFGISKRRDSSSDE